MSELFEALKNFQNKPKKHFVTIQNETIEVTLEKKIEIIRHGENNYVIKGGVPFRIELKSKKNKFFELDQIKSDPFWPTESFIWKK